MSDTVKGYTLRGKDYYSNIRGIRFEPIKKYDVALYYKKGEKKVTKFLGFVLSEQTFEEDLYKRYGNLYTSEELVEKVGYLFIMGGEIYEKAAVTVDDKCWRFETNAEAEDFIETLKRNCEKAGNPLL